MEVIEMREAAAGDAAFLFRLMNDSAVMSALNETPTEESDWEEAVEAWSGDPDERGYIVSVDGVPAGWFAVNGLAGAQVFLKMAALLPGYQGRGIGGRVLTRLLETLKAEGVPSAALFTNQNNLKARRCYEKCGFRVTEALVQEMSDGTREERYRMEIIL